MSGGVPGSYVSEWRQSDPKRAYAWLFLRPAERVRYGACAALVQEWWKIVHDVREPQVAVAKLGWWREELQRAAEGGARHPLTQSLFADALVRGMPSSCWTAVVDAALPMVDAPPSADFPAQRRAAAPLATAIAELETRVWFGAQADGTRAAAVIAIGHLVTEARALASEAERGRSSLPMSLLARHGLTVEDLAADGLSRRAALRDHAGLLRDALADAAILPGPLTLFRAVALQHDASTLERAADADDPLAALQEHGAGLGQLLKTWRAARTWRGMSSGKAQS